jgi:hypothetical protein
LLRLFATRERYLLHSISDLKATISYTVSEIAACSRRRNREKLVTARRNFTGKQLRNGAAGLGTLIAISRAEIAMTKVSAMILTVAAASAIEIDNLKRA